MYSFHLIFLKISSSILTSFHKRNTFSVKLSLFVENFISFIRKKNVKFSYLSSKKLFIAKENNYKKYYLEKSRCFWLYRNGIGKRGEFIKNSYCLNNIKFSKKDIIIDCGANSGDLFINLSKYIMSKNYFGIEPNPIDYEVLKLNCPNIFHINKALAEKNSYLDFFISTANADSSLIKPKYYDSIKKVECLRLDTLLDNLNLNKIKLLKLEAEGYEPEILIGAGDKIKNFEYIAVDGGYERGEQEEQTFTTIANFLIRKEFELVDINFKYFRALFRNTK